MGALLEGLRAFLESDDGKEFVKKFNEEQEFTRNLDNKYIEKFRNMSLEERIALVNKVRAKYNSEEYREREWSAGHFPSNDLFWLYLDYAEQYGEDITLVFQMEYPKHSQFTTAIYKTPEGFYVQRIDSQGSIVQVDTEDEINERLSKPLDFLSL